MEIKKVSQNLSIKFEYFELFYFEDEVETDNYIFSEGAYLVSVTRDIISKNKNKNKTFVLKITIINNNQESQANIQIDDECKKNIMLNLDKYLNNKSSNLVLGMVDNCYSITENTKDKKLNVKISTMCQHYTQTYNY